jgi:D-glycero-alpha-D-manno-heptose-7-phosphate kinase
VIISRTPYRISFFGGGTDYPEFFEKHDGAVLATSIDKYCYLTTRFLPPFFEHRHRVVYSLIELTKSVREIRHASVRECLTYLGIDRGVEIHHQGDLPARSGVGSSSSFTVGLLNALQAMGGCRPSPMDLARGAITVEREMIREAVGCQDQVMAAVGGLARITFGRDGSIGVDRLDIDAGRLGALNERLMLVFTGIVRTASEIAREQIRLTESRTKQLLDMREMVDEAVAILRSDRDLAEFGRLLHRGWELKRALTSLITTSRIDEIYASALRHGAIGGKLLGAGGGGFLLLYAEPAVQPRIRAALDDLVHVPFAFTASGSTIVYTDAAPIAPDAGAATAATPR